MSNEEIINEAPSLDDLVRVIREGQCPSVSGRSTLTYHLGQLGEEGGEFYVRIYDNTGKAQWFEMDGSWTATDVRSGPVLASSAAPWSTTFNPANRSFTPVGNATITYTSATTANVQFTINGVTRNAAIQIRDASPVN